LVQASPDQVQRDEIERRKYKITKRTHFSVKMNGWAFLSDDDDECIFRMPGKAMKEDMENSGLR